MDTRRPADDREGASAARLALVVGAEPGAGLALLGHGLGVPGGEDAVPEGQAPDPDGREEIAKLVCHGSLGPPAWRRTRARVGGSPGALAGMIHGFESTLELSRPRVSIGRQPDAGIPGPARG